MVKVVFGCMTFGEEGKEQSRVYKLEDCQAILDVMKKYNHLELDSARMYGGGTSEEYLRKLDVEKQGFKVATKNYPSGHAKGSVKWVKDYDHSKQGIVSSMEDSLQALGTKQVDLYYLHAPDREVPFEETVQALKEEHDQGRFTRWGLSNYKAEEVDQIVELCNKHGLIKPAVYQGVYNAICRSAEPELLPTLRKHNIAFYIYNPLGGGFFAGNFKKDAEVEAGSRFDPNRGQGKMYRSRYWNDAYFEALDAVRPACEAENITLAAAALRWLQHHSALKTDKGDAIIIGASSLRHIEQNLKDLEGPPLPKSIVDALDKAWQLVQDSGAAPKYHH